MEVRGKGQGKEKRGNFYCPPLSLPSPWIKSLFSCNPFLNSPPSINTVVCNIFYQVTCWLIPINLPQKKGFLLFKNTRRVSSLYCSNNSHRKWDLYNNWSIIPIHFNCPPLKFVCSKILTSKKNFAKYLKNIRSLIDFYSHHTLLGVLSEGKTQISMAPVALISSRSFRQLQWSKSNFF